MNPIPAKKFFKAAITLVALAGLHVPGLALEPLGAETAYLASPEFRALMLESSGEGIGCTSGPHVLEVRELQRIEMSAGNHPASGLWTVRFDTSGCGIGGVHNVFFAARSGSAPQFFRLPGGDTHVSASDYVQMLATPAVAAAKAACGDASRVVASSRLVQASTWQEQWRLDNCSNNTAGSAFDWCISRAGAQAGGRGWAPGICATRLDP